nr:MAG TPA: N acetylmuramidase [Caudoviricetes sp.]
MIMAVKIGSARMGENGKITGGRPGDQTGKEVSTQNWYAHSKGWRVFRAKNAGVGCKIAECMEKICANDRIGYNQAQRGTLYAAVKGHGFDPDALKIKVNTDCSAAVRVCCCYAGITVGNFNTANEASYLLATGAFVELTGSEYTRSSDRLRKGDILVTRTKGHTVVVLTDGKKAEIAPEKPLKLGDRELRNGMEGEDVRQLQSMLIQLGYDCGRWGADGDFGDMTEMAVKCFQQDHDLACDGIAGKNTFAALDAAICGDMADADYARIVGGNCYVRDAPNTDGKVLDVAGEGEQYRLLEVSENGWMHIQFRKTYAGWVSGKYARLV